MGEHALDSQTVITGPDHVRLRTLTAEELEGLDQKRLSGPGFPGESGKTCGELELYGIDDCETTNRESLEHCRSS